MEASKRFWIPCLQLLCVLSDIFAFNLDTKVPIVKEGVDGSYFGFSIAQHALLNEGTGLTEHVLLVGAPRDNITDDLGHPDSKKVVRPGNVYKCPLTSNTDDCDPIGVFRSKPFSGEDRTDQWLGVSVVSQGIEKGQAVACAHRYKYVGPSYSWGQGICMSMSNTLDEGDVYEPCAGKTFGHNDYGFCQAGTSVDVSDDGDILIGSPGPVNWRGAVDKNSIRDALDEVKSWYFSPVKTPIEGTNDPEPATGYYSYLGMSTKICNILGGRPTYIGGAPRAERTGQVLMFMQGENRLSVQPEHYLTGELFGSYFGYDLAVIDINGDGKEDLAVGAPFYHGPRVGGAVYIYMNGKDGISAATVPTKLLGYKEKQSECNALDCTNARFGFSLANAGDLDRDGYDDLAVGAPYEGMGAVYIYRGSINGIVEEPSQRIYAAELQTARPLTSFGYSLSGGMDMDGNGYPDLAVGSFNSDKTLILRSRPVVNIQVIVTNYPQQVDPRVTQCTKDGRGNNCFTLRLCFAFTAEPKDSFTEKLDIDYVLEAEKFSGRQLSRIFFKGHEPSTPHMMEKSIRINEQTSEAHKCRDHLVYLINNNLDFLNPIVFRVTAKLKDLLPPTMVPGGNLPSINTYPILNEVSSLVTHPVDFVKNCGVDGKCQSNLAVQGRFLLGRDPTGEWVLKVGVDKELVLAVVITNNGEDAHETSLTIHHDPAVTYIGLDQGESNKYNCIPYPGYVSCSIGNPMTSGERAGFNIRFDPSQLGTSSAISEFRLRVNTTSSEIDDQDDFQSLSVLVIIETDMLVRGFSDPAEIFYSGVAKGESAINYEDEIGLPVMHSYEVKNSENGRVAKSKVYISWPYEVENRFPQGKHLLYLTREPEVDGDAVCHIDPDRINPIDVLPGSRPGGRSVNATTAASRLKRDASLNVQTEYDALTGREHTTVTLDCDQKTAKCFTFECDIGPLEPQQSVVIKIFARLWNSTFLEDFRTVSAVNIFSKAEVKIDPSLNIRQINNNTANDVHKAMTKALPDIDVQAPPGIALWKIIVAAVAGVILLIIIVILLWKCGFFKRKTHDDMQKHKVKVDKKKKNYQDFD